MTRCSSLGESLELVKGQRRLAVERGVIVTPQNDPPPDQLNISGRWKPRLLQAMSL